MEAEKGSSPAAPPPPARLKIAGAWSGILEVQLELWTLPMLRSEVAARSGGSPDYINLICGGKLLRDDEGAARSLLELGLKNNSKLLATAVSPDSRKTFNNEAAAEAGRSQKLDRIRAAALALAERHGDGSLPVEDFNMEIEDQSGQKLKFGSETDQRGLMMGLMLHSNAKSLITKQQYKDALDVLSMAEEAFSLCDPKVTEMIDNVPILELDTVWCYFMLRDTSCLSVAGIRLAKARKGFNRSYGKDSTRLRLLQAGRQAELAIYLRLELLEGVVAYYSGNFEESRKSLSSAQARYGQLQVPDEVLSLLMSMGYKERAAKRALRMTGQDIQCAVDLLVEERARKIRRHEEDLQRRNEIMEQKLYGKTAQNKAVDLESLNELVSIGFERHLAAEALRLNENDAQKALDDLTDPEKNCNLQHQIELRKKLKSSRPTDADIEAFVAMGYDRSAVVNALQTSRTKEDALRLLSETAVRSDNQQAEGNPPAQGQSSNPPIPPQGDSSGGGAAAATDSRMDEERDVVMEDELAKELTGDPLADYDIEFTKEGEAIAEYMALLDSTASTSKGSK